MGVTIEAGIIHLLFNSNFVADCSIAELATVLLHEIHHLLFGHIWMRAADFPDRQALVIAQETSANQFVQGPFPGQPILLADYPQLPPNEDTVTRYHRLAKESGPREEPKELDDHSQWEMASGSPVTSAAITKVAVEEALSTMSDQEIGQVDQRTINAVADIVAGTEAGFAIERIEQIRYRRTDVPWRRLFREFVRQGAEPQPTFMRPPRRFPAMLGLVPGRFHRPNRASVIAIIDTSSSVGPRELALISSELEVIAATNDVVVVECDAAVRRVYPFTSSLTEVRGRGGTDFRPPLEESFLAKHRPGLAIFFTDGHGPAPTRPPSVPLVWCLTANGIRPAPWGREIRLPH